MPHSTQQLIVTQARTWLRTPFHHQARLKKVGCDCLGLIVGVVDELELRDKDGVPDTFMASFAPAGQTPAYRGMAYVVIKDFPLGDFGNRIPNFTFEVRRTLKKSVDVEDKIPYLRPSLRCGCPSSSPSATSPARKQAAAMKMSSASK